MPHKLSIQRSNIDFAKPISSEFKLALDLKCFCFQIFILKILKDTSWKEGTFLMILTN